MDCLTARVLPGKCLAHPARVAELADALDLGSSAHKAWGFKSPLVHYLD